MVFEVLSKQYELAKLDEAKEATMVQVFDPAATVPDKPSKPHRLFIVLGVFIGALISHVPVGDRGRPARAGKAVMRRMQLS